MERQLAHVSITLRHRKTGAIRHVAICSCGWTGKLRKHMDETASDMRIHVGLMRHHPEYRDGQH